MSDSFDDAPVPNPVAKSPPRDPGDVRLLALLENASAGSLGLSEDIAHFIGWRGGPGRWEAPGSDRSDPPHQRCPQFSESLDAAMSLVPEGWGDVYLVVQRWRDDTHAELYKGGHEHVPMGIATHWVRGEAKTLPIALCIACLRARATQDGGR